jgi:plastocyanin
MRSINTFTTRNLRRLLGAGGLAALALGAGACGGNSSQGGPTAPLGQPSPATTIDIIGVHGAQAFLPDPSTIPGGHNVVWHNTDTVTHRIVLDDGELDTGTIAPGAVSAPMTIAAPGPYHCSIHPVMVGTITGGH